ncbi:MAG: hypothetical protein WCP85_14360 [Mariniphaga sp.]
MENISNFIHFTSQLPVSSCQQLPFSPTASRQLQAASSLKLEVPISDKHIHIKKLK